MKTICETDNDPWAEFLGKNVLIRTVTMIQVGTLVGIGEQELVLRDAAWVADTGRFADVLKGTIKPKEVEPWPDGNVIVGRGAVIDACLWTGDLLRSQV